MPAPVEITDRRAKMVAANSRLRTAIERYDAAFAAFDATPSSDAAALFDASMALDAVSTEMDAAHRDHSLVLADWLLAERAETQAIAAELASLRSEWSPVLDGARP